MISEIEEEFAAFEESRMNVDDPTMRLKDPLMRFINSFVVVNVVVNAANSVVNCLKKFSVFLLNDFREFNKSLQRRNLNRGF